MFGLFVVSLIGFTILAGLVVALMLADVAFATPGHAMAAGPRGRGTGTNLQLRDWASGLAEGVARAHAAKLHNSGAVGELAGRLFLATSYIVRRVRGRTDEAGPIEEQDQNARCPSCSGEMIGVTAPELFAIAGRLSDMDPAVASQVRQRAKQNAQRCKDLNASTYRQAQLTCPLMAEHGFCLVPNVRPVQCRTCWHDGDSPPHGETGLLWADGRAVGDAVEEGVERGLSAAGLDGTRYELNSGLAAVLHQPDAADQWSHGQPVLAGCKSYG